MVIVLVECSLKLNSIENSVASLREAKKNNSIFSSLVATNFFRIFLELQKTVFFLSGQDLTPKPLLVAGPLKKYRYFLAAFLTNKVSIVMLACTRGFFRSDVTTMLCRIVPQAQKEKLGAFF